jgi:hypothetical protein
MKKYFSLSLIVVLLGIFAAVMAGKNAETKHGLPVMVPQLSDSLFESGDLIFRDGRGIVSRAFRSFSLKDPRYSHAGILHKENNRLYVYHLIGGEEGRNNKMRKEPLRDFINPSLADGFAIYRCSLNSTKIDSLAGRWYRQGILFDSHFNLDTDDKMYCTEMVYKALCKVSGHDNFIPLNEVSGIRFVSCDNIYLSAQMKILFAYDYEPKN